MYLSFPTPTLGIKWTVDMLMYVCWCVIHKVSEARIISERVGGRRDE